MHWAFYSSRGWLCMHTVLPLASGKTFFLLNLPHSGFFFPSRVSVGAWPSHSFVFLAWCHDDGQSSAVFQRKTPPPTPTANYYKTWHCIPHPSLVHICFPERSSLQRKSSSLMEEIPLSQPSPRGEQRFRKPWLLCIVPLLLLLFYATGALIFTSLKVRWQRNLQELIILSKDYLSVWLLPLPLSIARGGGKEVIWGYKHCEHLESCSDMALETHQNALRQKAPEDTKCPLWVWARWDYMLKLGF